GAGRIGGDAGRRAGRTAGTGPADRAHGAGRVPDEPADRPDRARPSAAQAGGGGGHRRRGGGGAGRLGRRQRERAAVSGVPVEGGRAYRPAPRGAAPFAAPGGLSTDEPSQRLACRASSTSWRLSPTGRPRLSS